MSFKTGMIAASVALVMMSTGAMAEDKVLHVYNWSDYIAPNTLEDFQKALWEKKKLVLQTRNVITLDRLDRHAPDAPSRHSHEPRLWRCLWF